MFSSKKSIEAGVLVYLIAGIAVFAVTMHLVVKLGTNAEKVGRDEACRKSIEFAAISKRLPSVSGIGSGRSYVPLQCGREDIILKHKDIVEDGKINQNKAHKILADEMYRCWMKTGEGTKDPFSNWDTEGESYCMICGIIKFDNKLSEFIKERSQHRAQVEDYMVTGFLPYLMKTKVPYQEASYYEVLYGEKPTVEDLRRAEDDAKKGIVLPGSTILVQMYKLESKSTFSTYTTYIGLGIVVAAGATAVLLPPVGLPVLSAVLLKLGAGVAVTYGVYGLFETTADAFKNCEDCNGVGGIHFLQATQLFDEEIELEYTDKEGNQKTAKTNLCTVLVN